MADELDATACEATNRWVPFHSTSADVAPRGSSATPVSIQVSVVRSSRAMVQPPVVIEAIEAHQEPNANQTLLSGFGAVGIVLGNPVVVAPGVPLSPGAAWAAGAAAAKDTAVSSAATSDVATAAATDRRAVGAGRPSRDARTDDDLCPVVFMVLRG